MERSPERDLSRASTGRKHTHATWGSHGRWSLPGQVSRWPQAQPIQPPVKEHPQPPCQPREPWKGTHGHGFWKLLRSWVLVVAATDNQTSAYWSNLTFSSWLRVIITSVSQTEQCPQTSRKCPGIKGQTGLKPRISAGIQYPCTLWSACLPGGALLCFSDPLSYPAC